MNPALPAMAAAALYIVGVGIQLRDLIRHRRPPRSQILSLHSIALVLHATGLYLLMLRPDGVDLGLFPIAALVALVMLAFLLMTCRWQPLESLLLLIAPLAAAMLVGAVLTNAATHPRDAFAPGLVTHAFVSLAAYTVLAMAATQAVVLSIQEHALWSKRHLALLPLLPPLLSMEQLLFQLLWSGLILLTLAILSGFLFMTDMFAQQVVHHTVLALMSWAIFAGLLAGRYLLGWRGPTATRWTLIGFGLLALAYFGSRFVLEVLLS